VPGKARRVPGLTDAHLAILFARDADVEPNPELWPELRRGLIFGPISPASFRPEGPDCPADAVSRTAQAAAAFGHLTSPELNAQEGEQRQSLRATLLAAAA
jgi:hypothetical protein